ncbi:MAG: hypothetical protein HOJ57_24480 [Lentisphaerae bacterium]|nr:hypothetical protein [Lentisphaerota bacterium]
MNGPSEGAAPELSPGTDDERSSLDVDVTTGRKRLGSQNESLDIVPPDQEPDDSTARPGAGEGPAKGEDQEGDEAPHSKAESGDVDTDWARGISRGTRRDAQRLTPSEWDQLIRQHSEARGRLTPTERRAVDEYYRRLRDLR